MASELSGSRPRSTARASTTPGPARRRPTAPASSSRRPDGDVRSDHLGPRSWPASSGAEVMACPADRSCVRVPARVEPGRAATARARRALVDDAREALAVDPDHSLADLAATLNVSATHLSRLLRAATGHTIARHRMRLRARAALDRLAGGEQQLARLAADLGFANQSHLCRVIRNETGHTPSSLRRPSADRPRDGRTGSHLSPTPLPGILPNDPPRPRRSVRQGAQPHPR